MNQHFTIEVFLYHIEPKIWRKFSIPSEATLGDLHECIQKAMGWSNEQEHEFLHGKGKKLDQVISHKGHEYRDQPFFTDEASITLSQFVGRKRIPLRILYRYDLIVEWIHVIVIKAKTEEESPDAFMIDGERACPIENSGGAHEYIACLNGESRWMQKGYDPEVFDISSVKLS